MAVKPRPGHPVSLVQIPLSWDLSAEAALLLVRDDPHPFALVGLWAGGGALIGSAPVRVAASDEDVFALLDEQPAVERMPTPAADSPTPVGGGWFGWLGRRPGDISIQKGNFSFYVPLVTCILISVILTLLRWLFRR